MAEELNNDLRVLLLAGRFVMRGACAYTLRLLEGLKKCGVTSEMICTDAARVPSVKRNSLPIRESRALGGLRWRRAVDALADSLTDETRPDLIHVQTRSMARVGLRLADRTQIPYVLTIHDFLSPGERVPLNTEWGKRVIAVSQAVKDDLVGKARLPDELVRVISSGVEVKPYFTPPERSEEEGRTCVIGTAGPLERVKGHHYFLEAAKQILEAGFAVEFLIVGSGPEEKRLRDYARRLGIADHVTFVPQVQDYGQVLEALDIFCLTSLQQGLGTVMLEAMALGKPVVASNVGGVYSVVHDNETGVLVPTRNPDALAGKVIQMLHNPEWARTLARKGQRLVAREFSAEHMVEHTARLYRQVLQPSLTVIA